ncbi:MAG TPA: pyridoxal-phosphate dependent enzyme [Vicinamibacterales bacterium]|nr:pyridoxal-phosphate dependent enzyme [Vicinamibacterales bacterium]
MPDTIPTLDDIHAARTRIADVIRPTPLLQHPLLNERTGLDLHVKHENHNPTGAFKVRGGLNLVRTLSSVERVLGAQLAGRRVVAVMSGGNLDAAKLRWILG